MLELMNNETPLANVESAMKELTLPEKVKCCAIYTRYKKIRELLKDMSAEVKTINKAYIKMDDPILESIRKIVSGEACLTPEELKDADKYLKDEQKGAIPENIAPERIPQYWFKVLTTSKSFMASSGKNDESLLKEITNVFITDQEGTDNFTLHFEFNENEFITNKKLSVAFFIENDVPFKCVATPIEWKGNDLTQKQVKKKQRNKKSGQVRVVTKKVQVKSFFNFFKTVDDLAPFNPDVEESEEAQEKREKLEDNFDLAGIIADEIVPYSLDYFLGIEHSHEDDFENEDDDSDDGNDDDDDEKGSKDKSKSKSKGKPRKGSTDEKTKKEEAKGGKEEKPECKNQ